MSIQDLIVKHEGNGLSLLQSEFFGEESPRFVYVSDEVQELLFYEAGNAMQDRLRQSARALLDDFIEGGHITVGCDPDNKKPDSLFARVGTKSDNFDMWDVRCIAPRPGLRIFGAFAEKDVFIALTWNNRENIDNNWPETIEDCIASWRNLFQESLPLRGKCPDDYISPPCNT